jgi:hypothetical protein
MVIPFQFENNNNPIHELWLASIPMCPFSEANAAQSRWALFHSWRVIRRKIIVHG